MHIRKRELSKLLPYVRIHRSGEVPTLSIMNNGPVIPIIFPNGYVDYIKNEIENRGEFKHRDFFWEFTGTAEGSFNLPNKHNINRREFNYLLEGIQKVTNKL
jgi:hypothetical protein